MANVLYMAVSKDGFIAGPDDETPWSDEEWQSFRAFVMSCDAVLVGRKTFEILQVADEFVEGTPYIVATHDSQLDVGDFGKVTINAKSDVPHFEQLGIIGGGELNGQLAKLGVIDEIFLDIEPIELKAGTKLFGDHDIPLKLELLDSRQIGDATVQRHFKVVHP